MTNFNINRLFEDAFGYVLPGEFKVPGEPDREDTPNPYTIAPNETRKEVAGLGSLLYKPDDLLGVETFLPITFSGLLDGEAFELTPSIAVASVACQKTIVSTALVDRAGEVNELVSTEAYVINVKGILLRPDDEWPESQLIELHDMFRINAAITMRSALTDIFIRGEYNHKVIVRSFRIQPTPGVHHAIAFELDIKSDGIFILEL
ncbi:MAG: hypothetical protein KAF40_01180 [Flavihumibacter sp.]|nr:hypothetical protein [Flavihumibacter sp.]